MRERSRCGLFDTGHVRDAFSRAAPSYEANAALQREIAHHCVATLDSRLACPDPLILDAGAGTGHVAIHAAACGIDWNLLALDISHPMCQLAARHNQRVIRGDMARLPFRNQIFDGVISSLALQWAPDPLTVLHQLALATRPGGWAVLSTFGPGTLRELAATFESLDGDPRVTPFPSRAKLIELADRAGWRVVRCDRQTRITQQESLGALMRSLKAIGATDRRSSRRRGLTTPDLFRKAAARYPADPSNPRGITATWEVVIITLQKPSQ
jgi:malonyl-CoA O-methyltransferase